MSISGIGSSASSLLQLTALAQLNRAGASTDASSDTPSTPSDTAASSVADNAALTGSGKGDLGSLILELLLSLQNGVSSPTTSTDPDGTSSTASTASTDDRDAAATIDTASTDSTDSTDTADDPLAELFAALDTDGDGSISETELASFISDLDGSDSEKAASDVADATPPPPPADAASTDASTASSSTDTTTVASSEVDQSADKTQQATFAFGMPMAEMARIIATYGAAQTAATAAA